VIIFGQLLFVFVLQPTAFPTEQSNVLHIAVAGREGCVCCLNYVNVTDQVQINLLSFAHWLLNASGTRRHSGICWLTIFKKRYLPWIYPPTWIRLDSEELCFEREAHSSAMSNSTVSPTFDPEKDIGIMSTVELWVTSHRSVHQKPAFK